MNSIDRLYAEAIPAIVSLPTGEISETTPKSPLILAGSFNPVHDGHREMLAAASSKTGKSGYFEMSIRNVDKPLLPREQLSSRIAAVASEGIPLLVTNAPRFTEKSSIFPDADFLIGFDTFVRLLDSKYYPDHVAGTATAVENSLNLIQENGCRFIVAGRTGSDGIFHDINGIEIPSRYRKMFTGLTETEFRVDISSTELRDSSG
ncbi:MAG: hypothetical protein O3B95_07260 [Chloroflexi bacterium]|nr:hypothetical protein [Chloroflexota bacterium]